MIPIMNTTPIYPRDFYHIPAGHPHGFANFSLQKMVLHTLTVTYPRIDGYDDFHVLGDYIFTSRLLQQTMEKYLS